MKTLYISADKTEVFSSRKDCIAYDRAMRRTVRVPLIFLREAIRQCTPYMVVKRERDWLKEKLEECLPKGERPKKDRK